MRRMDSDHIPSDSPAGKVVLVVDDDENIRAVLDFCMKKEGFQVVTAVDGADAVAKIENKTPHLIITDLMMPGHGGYDFVRMLPGAGLGKLRIFVMTGGNIDSSTIDMIRRETGVLEFFAKPLELTALAAAAHRHLKTTPRASR